jgi:hypothetical protein
VLVALGHHTCLDLVQSRRDLVIANAIVVEGSTRRERAGSGPLARGAVSNTAAAR